jgi:hypothetical protein
MGNPPSGNGPSGSQQIAQGEKELSSGLATALNQLGAKNTQVIQGLGAVVAAFITFATTGVLGVVAAAVTFVASLVPLFQSSGPDEIQKLGQTLVNLIQQFEQAEAAKAVDDRLGEIFSNQVKEAQSAEASLNSWANELPLQPPDEVTNILGGTGGLLGVLAALAPPTGLSGESGLNDEYGGFSTPGAYWLVPANYQVFWDDSNSADLAWPPPPLPRETSVGYGKQAPKSFDSNGNVFSHTYILPAFLYAISVFLSVGAVIDPKFKETWRDSAIRPTACFLQSVHDYITTNLTYLTPGPWSGQTLASWTAASFGESYQIGFGTSPTAKPGVFPALTRSEFFGSGGWQVGGITIEYGTIDKFSGYSSVGLYTLTPPFSLQSSDPAPYSKFMIRLQKRFKDVYIGIGLPAVRNMVNSLKTLAGDPPLPWPNPGDWSMREVAAMAAGLPGVPVNSARVSLVAVARFLENTLPADTPPLPTGPSLLLQYFFLRSLLEPPGA